MSTIDPNAIDPSVPTEGQATTASVRANEQATQDQFQNAKNDIEALEAGGGEVTDVLTTKGDLLTRDATGYARKPAGTNGFLVGYASADATGLTAIDPGTVGTTDHNALQNLVVGDPHTQYLTPARGAAAYAPIAHVGAAGVAHGVASGVQDGFMGAEEWSKLDGIDPGAKTGDMLKSVYDVNDAGIVDNSLNVAANATNATGATIVKGTFVQGSVGGQIIPAEPVIGGWAIAVADENITAGATGRVLLAGVLRDFNTTGGATGDTMYLAAGGGFTTTQPAGVDYQVVGEIWNSNITTGSFFVKIGDVVVFDPAVAEIEGATGSLLLNILGSFNHFNASTVTWTEVEPGAGESTVFQLVNMVAGTNLGRIQFDFSGAPIQPANGAIAGTVSIHLSVEFQVGNEFIDFAPALNGAPISLQANAYTGIGAGFQAGTVLPLSFSIPVSGLSDGDELSIVTRGSVGTHVIHSMSVSFLSSDGGSTAGGDGGVTVHQALLGREATDQHPQAAITSLVPDLAAKATTVALDAHINDTLEAHAASAIDVTPTGNLAATDVQGGLEELDDDLTAHVGNPVIHFADTPAADGIEYSRLNRAWVPVTAGITGIDGLTDGVNDLDNLGLGTNAAGSITSGSNNTITGNGAGPSITTGSNNTAYGWSALNANTDALSNVAIGNTALRDVNGVSGGGNTAVGNAALQQNASGGANTAVGNIAASFLSTGFQNSVFGANTATTLTSGAQNIIIGEGAEPSAATVNNELTLGNADINRWRIPGINIDTDDAVNNDVMVWDGTAFNFQQFADYAPLSHVGSGGNTQHPDATGSVSGFMTAQDKTKLDSVDPTPPIALQGTFAGDNNGDWTLAQFVPVAANWTFALFQLDAGAGTFEIFVNGVTTGVTGTAGLTESNVSLSTMGTTALGDTVTVRITATDATTLNFSVILLGSKV